MNRTDKLVSGMQNITRVLWSAAALLAPWLVPIGSAIIFGWSMFQAALALGMAFGLALVVGVATAAGLETTNIGAAHAAVQLWHGWRGHLGKFATACGLIVFYIALGILSVTRLPVPVSTQYIAGAMFLLTPVAIISQALTLDLARVRQEIDSKQARDDERRRLATEQCQADMALKQKEIDLRLAELSTQVKVMNAQVRLTKARAVPVQAERVPPQSETGPVMERAAAVLDRTPNLSGDALALILGISGGYGRKLKRTWKAAKNGKGEVS